MKIIRMKEQLFLMIFMFATTGITVKAQSEVNLQTGDLLFRETVSVGLSQAIDQVTQTTQQTHFSHVGLVVVFKADSIRVLHASPNGGTCEVSLQEFSRSEGDTVRVIAYRIKKQWQPIVPDAVQKAYAMLGKPYNFSYILSDSTLYCSEYIYKAFAADSIFELKPMTFKDPLSGEFSPIWINHYKNLKIEIPEGLPGCNPNGMAASEKLERLGTLSIR